jgi:TonB family protein
MRALCLAFLLLLAAPLAAEDKPVSMNVSVLVDVDAEGKVTGTEFRPGVHPSIQKLVRALVEPMRFEPAQVGDKPVSSRDALMCVLKLTPNGDGGYAVEVTDVRPAGSLPLTSTMPSYPPGALRDGVVGTVLLNLWIDERGRVDIKKTEVASSTFLRNGLPYDGLQARRLVEAALDAAAKWTFEQPHVDGAPVATRQLLPIRFSAPGPMNFQYGGLKTDPSDPYAANPGQSLGRLIRPAPVGSD